MSRPRVLIFDIETAPILGYVWGTWDQNIALNQIHTDWYILSWAAKWLGEKEVMYQDLRNVRSKDDKSILRGMWDLLDEADIVVTQNGKEFDQKKLNARFILQGMQPPSSFRHIDTLKIAKKYFDFTSNKLAYLTDKLNTKYKKLTDHKFTGFELWKECLAGNVAAWREMERYNKHDVLATEELYQKLIAWDSSINFTHYSGDTAHVCSCGSKKVHKKGYYYTASGKYQRYRCMDCGAQTYSGKNLLPKGEYHKGVRK